MQPTLPLLADVVERITETIVLIEDGTSPGSINRTMVQKAGRWNLGHLIWAGQIGAARVPMNGRDWAGWPTMTESIEGIRRDIRAKIRARMTLEQIITAYAPPTENDTVAYLAAVVARTGIRSDVPVSTITRA